MKPDFFFFLVWLLKEPFSDPHNYLRSWPPEPQVIVLVQTPASKNFGGQVGPGEAT